MRTDITLNEFEKLVTNVRKNEQFDLLGFLYGNCNPETKSKIDELIKKQRII